MGIGRIVAALLLACVPGTALAVEPEAALAACRDAAAAALPAPVRGALAGIDGPGRQLLALRGYLRARDIESRWSWTEAQIRDYQGSDAQQQAHAEVERVRARFAAGNPGYTLYVNLQVRSLDEQLRKWNANASVATASQALAAAAREACDPAHEDRFAGWLRGWQPPSGVNLAVPGLSAHGQGRAYDFQVMQGETLVAGTDSGRRQSDWIDGGWAARLAAAVAGSGPRWNGPLRSPDEPWHYAYVPPASSP